jgi:hypothetical protein
LIAISVVPSLPLLRVLLVDDHLLQRQEVELGTAELSVILFGTVLAGIDFKLIDDCPVLVPHEAEVVIVHLRFLQILYQLVILKIVNNRVFQ